jgi:hypothetical protein
MMGLEVGIYSVLWKLSSVVGYNSRRRSRLLSSREKSRDCLEVMLMLVSWSPFINSLQLISEFLHKTNETVILHIQADMLGYHGVSLQNPFQSFRNGTDSSPASQCN